KRGPTANVFTSIGTMESSPAKATKIRLPLGSKTTPRGSSPTFTVAITLSDGGSTFKMETELDSQLVTAARLPSAETASQNGRLPTGTSLTTAPLARSTRETESLVLLAVTAQLPSGVSTTSVGDRSPTIPAGFTPTAPANIAIAAQRAAVR